MAYSQEDKDSVFIEICSKIEKGIALRNILKEEGMPSTQTFYIWLDEDDVKSKQYARACELRAENMFEDLIDIADDSSQDVLTDDEGNERANTEFIQRSRLRVDTRKWILSKLHPKKYGDKMDITTDGNELNSTPAQIVIVNSVPEMKEIEG